MLYHNPINKPMKIAIIADSHDNIPRIDQMLGILKNEKIDTIIHCGDVTTLETIKYLSKKFNGKIYLSLGNVDEMHGLEKKDIKLKNVIVFENFGELNINNINIAFVHFPETAKKLADTKKYNFVFYGHSHKPWEDIVENTHVVNPGTLCGDFNRSTFATLDLDNKELKLVIL